MIFGIGHIRNQLAASSGGDILNSNLVRFVIAQVYQWKPTEA